MLNILCGHFYTQTKYSTYYINKRYFKKVSSVSELKSVGLIKYQ
jgi:hypothetical protein